MITTSSFPALIEAFFTDRLVRERRVSPHTIASYRDTFRLLVRFVAERLAKAPSEIAIADLDAPLVGTFLEHLEIVRHNTTRTRNVRLAAVHSFFQYVALQEPSSSAVCQRVLAMPSKRAEQRRIEYLTRAESDTIVAAPNLNTWAGRRDQALLLLAVQTGLRVSELTGLRVSDVSLDSGAHVRCQGKGRKERCTPLRKELVRVLREWLRERKAGPMEPLFPSARGMRLSQDGISYLLAKYVQVASRHCPSLRDKRVTPHVLRHSAAMDLLLHGVDRSVIALWLGHESMESTEPYIHADLKRKEDALARTAPADVGSSRFRPADSVLTFLESL
ncbi:MAG: tyrosine-type recombinase/integrase [Candidatus Peribacteraceae bacterium]|jgi:site-specific recombinase XerD|nr:site-specific integrase [Sulfuritalea sp.]